jgi:hypothetical protein
MAGTPRVTFVFRSEPFTPVEMRVLRFGGHA